jgi:hypothetical protein
VNPFKQVRSVGGVTTVGTVGNLVVTVYLEMTDHAVLSTVFCRRGEVFAEWVNLTNLAR